MSAQHKSVFADYENRGKVELTFSEENPEKNYEFGDEIGRGAFAVIKKCYRHDDKDRTLYAAKFVKYDDEALKILKREVAMIQKWEHEKLIHLFDVYIVRKYVVLIMEWFDGKNLLPYLIEKQEAADKSRTKSKLSEKDIAQLVKCLVAALTYLHSNKIAYLDIKPDNIMVKGSAISSQPPQLKLVDYDNCRCIEQKHGDVVDCIGTPEFTAPEALVYECCSVASDMWSVGVLIHVMLTAKSPFHADDEDEVKRKVAKVEYKLNKEDFGRCSEHPRKIIEGCFKRIPEKRMTLKELETHPWLKNIATLKQNLLSATTEDFKRLKECLEELESEEPVCASCVLRSFKEEEYDSPEEEDDDDE